jgi:hypothetical protein
MSTQISIKQLPQITEINSGNLILVQSANATNTLDFKNFVIGLDNTTFGTTITQHSTDITVLSGTTIPTFSANIMTKLTADVTALSANLGTNILKNKTQNNSLSSILFNGNANPTAVLPMSADGTGHGRQVINLFGLPIDINGTTYNILISATG